MDNYNLLNILNALRERSPKDSAEKLLERVTFETKIRSEKRFKVAGETVQSDDLIKEINKALKNENKKEIAEIKTDDDIATRTKNYQLAVAHENRIAVDKLNFSDRIYKLATEDYDKKNKGITESKENREAELSEYRMDRSFQSLIKPSDMEGAEAFNERLLKTLTIVKGKHFSGEEKAAQMLTEIMTEYNNINYDELFQERNDAELMEFYENPVNRWHLQLVGAAGTHFEGIEKLGIDEDLIKLQKQVNESYLNAAAVITQKIGMMSYSVYVNYDIEKIGTLSSTDVDMLYREEPEFLGLISQVRQPYLYFVHNTARNYMAGALEGRMQEVLQPLVNPEGKIDVDAKQFYSYPEGNKMEFSEAIKQVYGGNRILFSKKGEADTYYSLKLKDDDKIYVQETKFVPEKDEIVIPEKPRQPIPFFGWLFNKVANVFGGEYGPYAKYNNYLKLQEQQKLEQETQKLEQEKLEKEQGTELSEMPEVKDAAKKAQINKLPKEKVDEIKKTVDERVRKAEEKAAKEAAEKAARKEKEKAANEARLESARGHLKWAKATMMNEKEASNEVVSNEVVSDEVVERALDNEDEEQFIVLDDDSENYDGRSYSIVDDIYHTADLTGEWEKDYSRDGWEQEINEVKEENREKKAVEDSQYALKYFSVQGDMINEFTKELYENNGYDSKQKPFYNLAYIAKESYRRLEDYMYSGIPAGEEGKSSIKEAIVGIAAHQIIINERIANNADYPRIPEDQSVKIGPCEKLLNDIGPRSFLYTLGKSENIKQYSNMSVEDVVKFAKNHKDMKLGENTKESLSRVNEAKKDNSVEKNVQKQVESSQKKAGL